MIKYYDCVLHSYQDEALEYMDTRIVEIDIILDRLKRCTRTTSSTSKLLLYMKQRTQEYKEP